MLEAHWKSLPATALVILEMPSMAHESAPAMIEVLGKVRGLDQRVLSH